MTKRNDFSKERVARPFKAAANIRNNPLEELVRHIGQISGKNDFKELMDSSKSGYDNNKKKGPKND